MLGSLQRTQWYQCRSSLLSVSFAHRVELGTAQVVLTLAEGNTVHETYAGHLLPTGMYEIQATPCFPFCLSTEPPSQSHAELGVS